MLIRVVIGQVKKGGDSVEVDRVCEIEYPRREACDRRSICVDVQWTTQDFSQPCLHSPRVCAKRSVHISRTAEHVPCLSLFKYVFPTLIRTPTPHPIIHPLGKPSRERRPILVTVIRTPRPPRRIRR